jgi:hypothetical protein
MESAAEPFARIMKKLAAAMRPLTVLQMRDFQMDPHIHDRWLPTLSPLPPFTPGTSLQHRIAALEREVNELKSKFNFPPPSSDSDDNRSNGGQYL